MVPSWLQQFGLMGCLCDDANNVQGLGTNLL
jgi:hypothetical protein